MPIIGTLIFGDGDTDIWANRAGRYCPECGGEMTADPDGVHNRYCPTCGLYFDHEDGVPDFDVSFPGGTKVKCMVTAFHRKTGDVDLQRVEFSLDEETPLKLICDFASQIINDRGYARAEAGLDNYRLNDGVLTLEIGT